MMARCVGRLSGGMSRNSFHSMLQKPSTALTCKPVGLAVQRRQRVIGAEDVAGTVHQKDVVALGGGGCFCLGWRGFAAAGDFCGGLAGFFGMAET